MKEFNLVASVGTLTPITLNYEDLEQQLTEFADGYKNIVITEEQKAEAKADVATLRKLKTELDDKRKEIKREYMKPCEEFEAKVKKLLSIIDEPIGIIDGKLKEFEEKRKAEKRATIQAIYAEEMDDYKDNVSLQAIYKAQWENATYSESAIRADIQEIKLTIDRETNIILSLKSEATDKAIKKYYDSGRNLGLAIAYINEYEDSKREILRRQEEEAKKKAEDDIKKAQIEAENTNRERIIISQGSIENLRQNTGSFETVFENTTGGFVNSFTNKVRLELEIDEEEVEDVLDLLKGHGYTARRI